MRSLSLRPTPTALAGLALLATLALSGTVPTPADAKPSSVAERADDGRWLLILARDGAFAGNLAALAGRPLVLDAARPGAGDLALRLTEAHGWTADDRARWREGALADAADAVCDGRAAALVTLADPGDTTLAAALERCQFRLIDLGDGVSRAFAGSSASLTAASFPGPGRNSPGNGVPTLHVVGTAGTGTNQVAATR